MDTLKHFIGDRDMVAWIRKVKFVAKLQKIEDLLQFLSLYLERNALALCMKLNDSSQANAKVIKTNLVEKFSGVFFLILPSCHILNGWSNKLMCLSIK